MKKNKLCKINRKLKILDWILIIIVILAPMTGLRIGKIGPSEILCVLWIGLNYNYIHKIDIFFLSFWYGFITIIFIGSIIGNINYPTESNFLGIFIWIYLAIVSIGTCTVIQSIPYQKIEKIINYISIGTSLWYSFIYLYSRQVSYYFFNAPLWYQNLRFSGGGTNPHQVALLLAVASIIAFLKLIEEKGKLEFIYLICLLSLLFLLLQTRSSTGLMSVTIGVIYILFRKIWSLLKEREIKIMFIIIIIISIVIGYSFVVDSFMNWVRSDPNGMGRFEIFMTIGNTFWKSPIFGLGPGTHGINGTIEFHNTYLEILAMGGLIGFGIFMLFSLKIFLKIYLDVLSASVMLCLYIFGFAGFSARRLVFWLMISYIYIYPQKKVIREERELNGK